VTAGGAETMHQNHPLGGRWITSSAKADAVAPPGPVLGGKLAQTVAF
jgi:hypothetical protein